MPATRPTPTLRSTTAPLLEPVGGSTSRSCSSLSYRAANAAVTRSSVSVKSSRPSTSACCRRETVSARSACETRTRRTRGATGPDVVGWSVIELPVWCRVELLHGSRLRCETAVWRRCADRPDPRVESASRQARPRAVDPGPVAGQARRRRSVSSAAWSGLGSGARRQSCTWSCRTSRRCSPCSSSRSSQGWPSAPGSRRPSCWWSSGWRCRKSGSAGLPTQPRGGAVLLPSAAAVLRGLVELGTKLPQRRAGDRAAVGRARARHHGRGRLRRVGVDPGLPLAAGFALGAIVAPPDAVAATAVGRELGLPRRPRRSCPGRACSTTPLR